MKAYMDITSENPVSQIWKLLRSFLDSEYVSARIKTIHNISDDNYASDIKKQSKQVGYCIRQAEEYFHASSSAGLATRPLMLYYGMTSLATALVLLRQDGSHSLDYLRKTKSHQHHGLILNQGSLQNIRPRMGTADFFGSIKCDLNIKDGVPWGLFGLFYESLVPCAFAADMEIHDVGKKTYLLSHALQSCIEPVQISALMGTTFNMLDLIKSLPDLCSALAQVSIKPFLYAGSLKVLATRHYRKDDSGNEKLEKTVEVTDCFIDGILPDDKSSLLSSWSSKNPNMELLADFERNVHLRQTKEVSPSEEAKPYWLPDALDDINGRLFYLIPAKMCLPEPASLFILSYCLGMLSRYLPDLWMRIIDKNVEVAEFTDSLLNVFARKFPNLILDQMTDVKHHVHA
jgi:hypothetical protein